MGDGGYAKYLVITGELDEEGDEMPQAFEVEADTVEEALSAFASVGFPAWSENGAYREIDVWEDGVGWQPHTVEHASVSYHVNPYADADVVFEGDSLDEARAAADEFASDNPCEFAAQGLGAVVSYHELECNLVHEDGECEDAFTVSTLTEAARERLMRYADDVDEAVEDLEY